MALASVGQLAAIRAASSVGQCAASLSSGLEAASFQSSPCCKCGAACLQIDRAPLCKPIAIDRNKKLWLGLTQWRRWLRTVREPAAQ